MHIRSYDETKSIMSHDAEITYKLDDKGRMTNIIFKRRGYYSYVDVVKKEHGYCILCFGDYKPLVISGNWHDVYLDEFNPRNIHYVSEKVDAGEYEVFDWQEFENDAHDYMLQLDLTDEQREEADEAVREVDCQSMKYECLDRLIEILDDPNLGETFFNWGMVPHPHYLCWMAIIDLAQDKREKDKENSDGK